MNALELAKWIEEDGTCYGDEKVVETIRRQHALIVQMVEALKAVDAAIYVDDCAQIRLTSQFDDADIQSSIAAANEYLAEQKQ